MTTSTTSHPMPFLAILSFLTICASNTFGEMILFEDNFEMEGTGQYVLNYASFPKWNVTRGTVDLLGPGYDYYPGNGFYVDLDGTTNQGGRLESKANILLDPGIYQLRFRIANNAERQPLVQNTMQLTLPGLFDETFSRTGFPPQFEIIERTLNVSSFLSTRIIFDQFGNDSEGILIDGIRISTVPEPSSAILVVGTWAVTASFRRRRSTK